MSSILVYSDRGVSNRYFTFLWKILHAVIDTSAISINKVQAKDLLHANWEEECILLIVPGGADRFYHRALDGKGTDRIRAFVENGGGYLGICAGAYFGAERIEFEKGGELEVCDDRSLAFYPGLAAGPALGQGKFCYLSEKGAEAARLSGNEEWYSYYNGGCAFYDGDEHPQVEVLSRYLDVAQNPAAIIARRFGKGLAILSGVHFECSVSDFSEEHLSSHQSFSIWKQTDCKRFKFLVSLLQRFPVQIIENFLGS